MVTLYTTPFKETVGGRELGLRSTALMCERRPSDAHAELCRGMLLIQGLRLSQITASTMAW